MPSVELNYKSINLENLIPTKHAKKMSDYLKSFQCVESGT